VALLLVTSLSFAGQTQNSSGQQDTDSEPTPPSQELLTYNTEHPPTVLPHTIRPASRDGEALPVRAIDQYDLAFNYLEGRDKPLNCMEAARWFEMAAKQGMPDAQYQLGLLHEKGKGVPQDYQKAAAWYKKAVRQDHVPAQNALGFLYYNGKGVPRDLVISLALFNIAAAQGNADAFQNTYIAASTMSFKSFDRAKTLAKTKNRKQLFALIGG
jgi:TPR repeat protein